MRSPRLALIFYCLGSLDLLGSLEKVTKESERESWRNDIWGLHAGAPVLPSPFPILNCVLGGTWGSGFKPSWYMTGSNTGDDPQRLVRVKSRLDVHSPPLTFPPR